MLGRILHALAVMMLLVTAAGISAFAQKTATLSGTIKTA